jgi:hypothetical protein
MYYGLSSCFDGILAQSAFGRVLVLRRNKAVAKRLSNSLIVIANQVYNTD